jgi:hypothetical protein
MDWKKVACGAFSGMAAALPAAIIVLRNRVPRFLGVVFAAWRAA